MKIALAGMGHESNTFNKTLTGLESFYLLDGDTFVHRGRVESSAYGIFDTLTKSGADVCPLFFANAIPSGPVRLDAYEYIKSRIIDKLQHEGPWDGICLALHGSMAVDGLHDPEGDLLETIRWTVGHEIPIICALDMHATLTERMALLADGYSVFRTAPHIDSFETGANAANIMLKILAENRKALNVLVKIPMLVSGEQSETRASPAKELFAALEQYDKLPNVLCASYVMGFPWADSPFGGAGALVTGWADSHDSLKSLANNMAKVFWDKRAEFVFSTPAMTPQKAIEAALAAKEHPVIISDSADNPTAGASQDNTTFLRMMIGNKLPNAVYTCIADPAAYRVCTGHTTGDEFTITIGGYFSGKQSERYTLDAKLINLAEHEGTSYAVLQAGGVIFTLSNKRCATYSPEILRALSLEPSSFSTIGIKAGYLSPEYQAMSRQSILALTDGDTALELANLPYTKTPRPMYPLDIDMEF